MRSIGAIILCVVIGAALTVMTAWALAAWTPAAWPSARGVYLVRDRWSAILPPGWPPAHHGIDRVGPGITATEINGYTGMSETHRALVVSVGWPMRALAWGQFGSMRGIMGPAAQIAPAWTSAWRERVAAGLPLESAPPGSALDVRRTLPLYPLGAGFAVNTGVYACAAWAGLVGLGVLRRRRRRAAGRCEACGYEVGMLAVCPECGTSVRAPGGGAGAGARAPRS